MSPNSIDFDEVATHASAPTAEAAEVTMPGITENGESGVMRLPAVLPREPANVFRVTNLADDFDAVDENVVEMFEGAE